MEQGPDMLGRFSSGRMGDIMVRGEYFKSQEIVQGSDYESTPRQVPE